MILSLQCVKETVPGEKWLALFQKSWPSYRQWFLSEGFTARKGYLTSVKKLQHYMPELMPLYEKLVLLAGGGDLEARYLSMYCPPAYMTGCSQLAWHQNETFLIRNYDYSPSLFEGVLLYTGWLKPVIGISDCSWGLLDGMNGDGLAASLSFGGRNVVGDGFGIPIIIRYILETCANTEEAIEKIKNIPSYMAYNVTFIDAAGHYATVYLAPGEKAIVLSSPIATNHQQEIDWPYYAAITQTVERKSFLESLRDKQFENKNSIILKFLQPPLYNYDYKRNFGTLYTSLYDVKNKVVSIIWPPEKMISRSFEDFTEENVVVHLLRNVPHKGMYK